MSKTVGIVVAGPIKICTSTAEQLWAHDNLFEVDVVILGPGLAAY